MVTTTITTKTKSRKRRNGGRKGRRRHRKTATTSMYQKLSTIMPSDNLYTWLRFNSPTYYFHTPVDPVPLIPAPAGGAGIPSPFYNTRAIGIPMYLNGMNPVNMPATNSATSTFQGAPVGDFEYYGGTVAPPSGTPFGYLPNNVLPKIGTGNYGYFCWSNLTRYAEFYNRCRIIKTYIKITVRASMGQNNPAHIVAGGQPQSQPDPITVTWVDGKYIQGENAPETFMVMSADDLRSQKHTRNWIISPFDNKPLVIKKKVDIRSKLGVRNLRDQSFTDFKIDNLLTVDSNNNNLITNPSARNAVFGFLKVQRASDPVFGTTPNAPFNPDPPVRFAVQVQMVSKVQFFAPNRNNPTSVVGVIQTNPPTPV